MYNTVFLIRAKMKSVFKYQNIILYKSNTTFIVVFDLYNIIF